MRVLKLALVASFLLFLPSLALKARAINAPFIITGEFNGWSATDTALSLGVAAGPDLNRWKVTTRVPAGLQRWKFMADAWWNHWGALANPTDASFNTIVNTYWNGGSSHDQGHHRMNFASGKYYTFRFNTNNYDTTTMTVMETDNSPISISSVGAASAPYAYIPARVTVTISAAKSAQENVIVRYTTDEWQTSSTIICDSTAATSYYADIPGQPAGTKIIYYVLTSTASSSTDWDLQTLAYNNNGGTNYSYTVLPPATTFHTVYPGNGVYAYRGGGPQFSIGEKVRTTGGATAYLTWDTTHIYAAFTGGTGNTDSYVILVDTNPGVASGAGPNDTLAGRGSWSNDRRPDVAFSLRSSTITRHAANTGGGWNAPTTVTGSCTSFFRYDSGALGTEDTIVVGIPRTLVGIANRTDSANFWIFAVTSAGSVWGIFDNQQDGKNFPRGTDSTLTLFDTSSVPAAPASPVSPTDNQANVASRRPTITWTAAVPGDVSDSIVDYYFEIGTQADLSDTGSFPLEVGWRGPATSITCTTTLNANTWYYWRVKAKDATGDESPWSSTWRFQINAIIGVDGSLNDWNSTEQFPAYRGTTTSSSYWYLTWDSTYLYGAWDRGTSFETTDVVFIYIDTTAGGSTTTPNWNGAGTHTIPFAADIFVSYRHRNFAQDYDHQVWNNAGSSWTFKDTVTGGSEYKNTGGNILEWSIPWSVIGTATTNFSVLMFVVNEFGSNYVFSSAPAVNPQGAAPKEFSAFLRYNRNDVGVTPTDRYYFRSNRTWSGSAGPTPGSFSPIVDGVKDAAWGSSPAASSANYRSPAPGAGDTSPPRPVPSGGLCRDVYVTNDAQWLYIGWDAFGDPFRLDDPGATAQSANYGFLVTDTSSYGSMFDPWKSAGNTYVTGYGANVWAAVYATFGNEFFSGANRYVSQGAAWDVGATLVANQDFAGYLPNQGAGWGEIRIPLANISPSLRIGDSIAIIHYSRHNGTKPGADDATPFQSSATSDWAASDAQLQFRDTGVIIYAIKQGVIDGWHVPESVPVSGLRKMRSPDSPTAGSTVNLLLRAKPPGILSSASVLYSTDSGSTWSTTALSEEFQSGEGSYWSGFFPSFLKDSVVLYYFRVASSAMTSYVYGADTWSVPTTSETVAKNNPYRFRILNTAPTAPDTSRVDVSPRTPTENDTLVATASGAADSDSLDLLRHAFAWYRNGIYQFTSFDSYAPYTSSVSPSLTSTGDTWQVRVTVHDGTDSSSTIHGPTVRVSPLAVWGAALPSVVNSALTATTGGITEWVWRDREGEAYQGTDAYDLREVRVQADSTWVYFLFRMGAYPLEGVHVAVAVDTGGGVAGGSEIGDQTSTLLDSGISSTPLRFLRQVIFHAAASGSVTAELDTAAGAGTNWITPPGGFQVSVEPGAGILEARVSRADLQLAGNVSARFAFATFGNVLGSASAINSTTYGNPSDVLDAVSIAAAGLNDTRRQLMGMPEDFDDADLDFAPLILLQDTGVRLNLPPAATSLQTPATGDTVSTNPPTFTWGISADTDASDTVIAWLFELADSGTALDGDVLYRVTVKSPLYLLPSSLPDSRHYTWRARPIDRAGNLGNAPAQTFFLRGATRILVNAPTDLQNLNNLRRMQGAEVAGTTIRWNWVAATHTESAPIVAYVIQVDTSGTFVAPLDSITLAPTARLHTWTGAQRGQTYYARILAVDTGDFWGSSPASDGIYVSRRQLDADSSDWAPYGGYAANSANLVSAYGEGIWKDTANDHRVDAQPNANSRDILAFQVTADLYNIYFLVPTQEFSGGVTMGQIAISYDDSSDKRAFQGANVNARDCFTTTRNSWERIVRWRTGEDDCYVLNTNYQTQLAGYSENSSARFVELCVPLEMFGGAGTVLGQDVNFTVATFILSGGGVGNQNGSSCDAVDVITSQASTWTEVSDQVVNYYVAGTFDTGGRVTAFSGTLETSAYIPSQSYGTVTQTERDLIMYNVFVDRFVSGRSDNPPPDPNMIGGDLQGLMDSMSYFNYMGFNCIYTSPVCDFGGGAWGYNQSDLYAVQWSFANPSHRWNRLESYIEFVKKARNHNIKAAVDWVPGQIYQGRTTTNHPDMFSGKRFGGERVREEMSNARQFFVDHSLTWAAIGNVGLRADNTKFYDPTDDASNGLPFYRYMRIKWDEVYPELYVFGEQPGGASDIAGYVNDGGRMDGQLDFPLRELVKSWVNGFSTASSFLSSVTGNEALYGVGVMAGFIENHDHSRTYHNFGGGGDNDGSKSGAVMGRMRAAMHFSAIHSQPPILFYGDEVPLSGWKPATYPFPPAEWDVGTERQAQTRPMVWNWPDGTWLRDQIADYYTARCVFPEIRGSNANRFIVNPSPHDGIVVYRRGSGDQAKVIGVVNRTGGDVATTIATGDAGITYRDWLNPAAVGAADGSGNLNWTVPDKGFMLVRGGYGRYNMHVDAGEPGVIVSVDNNTAWTNITGADGKCWINRVMTAEFVGTTTRTLYWWKPGYIVHSRQIYFPPGGGSLSHAAIDDTTVSFVTPDITPPPIPSGLVAVPRDEAVWLRWEKVFDFPTEDPQNHITYRVYRSQTPNAANPEWIIETLQPWFYDSRLDEGLTNGETYYYRITSCDRNGNNSGYSAEVTVVPRKYNVKFYFTTEGTSWTNVTSVQIAGNNPELGLWSPLTMTQIDTSLWVYETQFDPTEMPEFKYIVNGNWEWNNVFNSNNISYDRHGRPRLVKIVDHDGKGNTVFTHRWNVDGDIAPRQVRNVVATGNDTFISIGWAPNAEADVQRYIIRRSTDNATWTEIGDAGITQNTYTDTSVAPATTYYYQVRAVDWWNQGGDWSSSSSASLVAADVTAPNTPSGLALAPIDTASIYLSWTPNSEGDLAGYYLYRSTDSTVPLTLANRVSGSLITPSLAPTYTDTGVTSGVRYYYKLVAVDYSGNASTATTASAAYIVALTLSVDLANISGTVEVSGNVRSLGPSPARVVIPAYSGTVRRRTFGVFAGVPLTFRYSYNSGNNVEAAFNTSSQQREYTPPEIAAIELAQDWEDAPEGPTNTLGFAGNKVAYLQWTADSSVDVIGYVIERATASDTTFRLHTPTTLTATSYTDSGLTNGETYYYIVRSVDGGAIQLQSPAARMMVVRPVEPVWIRFRVEADRRRQEHLADASPHGERNRE